MPKLLKADPFAAQCTVPVRVCNNCLRQFPNGTGVRMSNMAVVCSDPCAVKYEQSSGVGRYLKPEDCEPVPERVLPT